MDLTVAVIDIGSNSIKLVVANKNTFLFDELIGTRISSGIGSQSLSLTEESILKGVQTVQKLLASAHKYSPDKIEIVATSAVREAQNKQAFTSQIKETTGHEIRILSGEEEAQLIANGAANDPQLDALDNFDLFDLGGGSLECINYRNGKVTRVESYPLGSVRLTEQFIQDPQKPFSKAALQAISDKVKNDVIAFPEKNFPLVGMGGGLSTARKILGLKKGKIKVSKLQKLLEQLSALSFEERTQIPEMPVFRADVIPTAFATILALANTAEIESIIHSKYNLRYGLAHHLLN